MKVVGVKNVAIKWVTTQTTIPTEHTQIFMNFRQNFTTVFDYLIIIHFLSRTRIMREYFTVIGSYKELVKQM